MGARTWAAGHIVRVAVAMGIALTVAATLVAESLPALTVTLSVEEDRVRAKGADLDVAVVGLRSAAGEASLEAGDLIEEPDVLGTWPAYRRFFERQAELGRVLTEPEVELIDHEGQAHPVQVVTRDLTALPASFFAQVISALGVWLIGFATYAFSNRGPGATAFLFTALGFSGSAGAASIYSTRPLVADASLFSWLARVNHLGALAFGAALSILLLVYPKMLTRRAGWLWASVPLFWVLEAAQLAPMRWVSVYNAVLGYVIVILVAGVLQWRATRSDPVGRASLGWMMLSVLAGICIFVVAITLPVVAGAKPVATQALALAAFALMYVGICFGVLQVRLFELDRWWFRTWTWILGGALVLATEAALVSLFELSDERALLIALVVAGFAYFPARQWLLGRFRERHDDSRTLFDPKGMIGAVDEVELLERFEEALRAAFGPLDLRRDEGELDRSRLGPLGRDLLVPAPGGEGRYLCHYRDEGRRLYRPEDAARADQIVDLGQAVSRAIAARSEGELEERRRIRRDLHDDLGASLSHIVQRAQSEEQARLGKKAMRDLREVLTALRSEPVAARGLIAELEPEIRERCGDGLDVAWEVRGETEAILTARQRANITRALREAATNAVKYGAREEVRFAFELTDDRLVATVENPIEVDASAEEPSLGLGLPNIRSRMEEVGGSASSSTAEGRFRLRVELPVAPPPKGAP